MNQRINNKLILILLLLIFATPTVVGILLYKNPAWLPTKTTNQGQFSTPPVSITVPKSSTLSWSIVLWDRKPCETACVNQLRALKQLRLALGRQFYNVHITLLQPFGTVLDNPFPQDLNQHVLRVRLNPEESEQLNTFPSGTLFIKNPNHQLILTYTPHVAPDALFHDLKHLLTVNPMSTQTHE